MIMDLAEHHPVVAISGLFTCADLRHTFQCCNILKVGWHAGFVGSQGSLSCECAFCVINRNR
jgi:hypothetical protein